MSEKTAKNDHDGNMKHKKRFALIAVLLISICIGMSWYGMHDANAQMKMHNSTDMVSTKWSGTWGGWGIAGGKYGQFTCATCHVSSTTNIKRIRTSITVSDTSKGNIPGAGATVSYLTTTGSTGTAPMGQDTLETAAGARICHVCHSITSHNAYKTSGTTTAHKGTQDCTDCHSHQNGFTGGDCIGCHTQEQPTAAPARVAVATQFNAASHHIQGVTLTNQHCYACHWEANPDGSPNPTYHTQTSNQPVDLVVWGSNTTRPTTYSGNAVTYLASAQTRTEISKITNVCLGCHNDTNKTTTIIFGDGKTPSTYSWDNNSIDSKYSSTLTAPWGKYSGANFNPKNTQTKAFSAHGNAGNNAQGWDTNETWPNNTGTIHIECYDCHNSHGSNAAGVTTSYSNTGGNLKNVIASRGGYTMTSNYTPTAGGSAVNHNPYNAGAALCFDCHNNPAPSTSRPWGYSTFGSNTHIMGYFDKPYWLSDQPKTYLNGAELRYPYKGSRTPSGGHFAASAALTSAVTGTIRGLCTYCHDPHGVSPTQVGWCSNGTSTNSVTCVASAGTWTSGYSAQQYGVPLLKGTWVTSPYREDAGGLAGTILGFKGGGSKFAGFTDASWGQAGHHIDQNAFSSYPTLTRQLRPGVTTIVVPWVISGSTGGSPKGLYDLTTAAVTSRITQSSTQFGGLCLKCHARTAIQTTTGGAWYTRDRIHNAVQGWASSAATQTWYNTNNKVHGYTCSKCHTAHNTCLPRLTVTNCLDWNHKGRVATGGLRPPSHSTVGSSGGGWGRFPGGGGGYGCQSSVRGWTRTVTPGSSGAYYFGTRGTTVAPQNLWVTCHNQRTGSDSSHRWNSATPW